VVPISLRWVNGAIDWDNSNKTIPPGGKLLLLLVLLLGVVYLRMVRTEYISQLTTPDLDDRGKTNEDNDNIDRTYPIKVR
jgi:hypothetical protein